MSEDDPGVDDEAPAVDDPPEVRNPFAGGTDPASADADPGDSPPNPDAPFASLAAETRERRRREPAEGDPFERVEVSEVDSEALWESLSAEDDRPAPGGDAEHVGGADDRPEHVVNKREYCQRCRHFSKPPSASCTNEGTDIVELVDADRFRVRGCPVAAEDGPPTFENP